MHTLHGLPRVEDDEDGIEKDWDGTPLVGARERYDIEALRLGGKNENARYSRLSGMTVNCRGV